MSEKCDKCGTTKSERAVLDALAKSSEAVMRWNARPNDRVYLAYITFPLEWQAAALSLALKAWRLSRGAAGSER